LYFSKRGGVGSAAHSPRFSAPFIALFVVDFGEQDFWALQRRDRATCQMRRAHRRAKAAFFFNFMLLLDARRGGGMKGTEKNGIKRDQFSAEKKRTCAAALSGVRP